MTALGTVGVVFPGDPRARGTWSGTPAGIAQGLGDLGFTVRRIDARPPRALDALRSTPSRCSTHGPRAEVAHARGSPAGAWSRGCLHGRDRPRLRAVGTTAPRRRPRRDRPDRHRLLGRGQRAGRDLRGHDDPPGRRAGLPRLGRTLVACRRRTPCPSATRCYERATACCLSTDWAARSVIDDYGIAAEKVHAVGIGRNHDPAPTPRDWRTPRFLFVGMDWLGKNGPGVLAAFARLREEHPDVTLDIVGAHPPLDAPGVTGHGVLAMGDPTRSAAPGSAVRHGHLLRLALAPRSRGHRLHRGDGHRHQRDRPGRRRRGRPDRRRRLHRRPRRRRGATGGDARVRRSCDRPAHRRRGPGALELFTWRAVAGRIVRALDLPQIEPAALAPFLEPAVAAR